MREERKEKEMRKEEMEAYREFRKTCPAHKLSPGLKGMIDAWSHNVCAKTKCQYAEVCEVRGFVKRWF